MRILVWSTAPWVKTGYGRNCKFLLKALKEEHEVFCLATYGLLGGSLNYQGTPILPSNGNFWNMGSWVEHWTKKLDVDLVIQHFDLWVCRSGTLKEITTPTVTYMPVDSHPLPKPIYDSGQGALDNIAMSEFAQQSFLQAEMPSSKLINHTVDHSTFYPEDKREAKKALGIDPDVFLIGLVGTNKGPRKNIPGQLLAFKEFLKDFPAARFYIHAYMDRDEYNPEGFRLHDIVEYLGLSEKVLFTDQMKYYEGLTDDEMRVLYSSFDLLSECSFGEGWGIPIAEAQACGTPVVGTNFSSIPEVLGEGGVRVEVEEFFMYQSLDAFQAIPSSNSIKEGYWAVYLNQDFYRQKALENSLRFTTDIWRGEWLDYLNLIMEG